MHMINICNIWIEINMKWAVEIASSYNICTDNEMKMRFSILNTSFFSSSNICNHRSVIIDSVKTTWHTIIYFCYFFLSFLDSVNSLFFFSSHRSVKWFNTLTGINKKEYFNYISLAAAVTINSFNYVVSIMNETSRMVSIISLLLIVILLHTSQALISNAVGRFPFLMPNVRPYRVS